MPLPSPNGLGARTGSNRTGGFKAEAQSIAHQVKSSLSLFLENGGFSATFAVEVLVTLRDRQWGEALLLTAGSVLAGLLVAAGGYTLGLADG